MKIVVGGQMDKQLVADLVKQNCADAEVSIKGDIEAALAIQTGQADYYVGACATGAGGALAMAIGLLGGQQCVSISIPGSIMSDEAIEDAVKSGKKAFGFVNTDASRVVPVLMAALIKNRG